MPPHRHRLLFEVHLTVVGRVTALESASSCAIGIRLTSFPDAALIADPAGETVSIGVVDMQPAVFGIKDDGGGDTSATVGC